MKCRIMSVVMLAAAILFPALAFSQDTREITKTLPLKSDGELSVDTYKGSIKVTTWDKPEVSIHATIESDDEFWEKYSAERVRDTDIEIEATEARISIKTDYSNIRRHHHDFWSWFGDGSGSLPLVHYTITMPATASLSVKDYKSRSTLSNLHSHVDFNTYKGNVEIADLEGSLKFETYRGEGRVEINTINDQCRFETYRGRVTITVPKKAGFDLDADLGYRTDFSTDFDVDIQTRGRHHRNSEFQGPINGGGSPLVLRSTRGSIRLRYQ